MLGRCGQVWEILTKKQTFSLAMIRRLHRTLHIQLGSIIGPAPSVFR